MTTCKYYQESPICTYSPECCIEKDGFVSNDIHPEDIEGDYCQFCGNKIQILENTPLP